MRSNLNTLTLTKIRIDTCHQQVKIIYRGDHFFHAQKHYVKGANFFTFSSIPKEFRGFIRIGINDDNIREWKIIHSPLI